MPYTLRPAIPKLPMKDAQATLHYYTEALGFAVLNNYANEYLLFTKDQAEIHLFLYPDLSLPHNYGMCYVRVENIGLLYEQLKANPLVVFPEKGHLQEKPWGQKEFSVIDNNHNLITFGEEVNHA